MNKKKIFHNAPAPLFVEALLGEERDVGYIDILCVSAVDYHRKTGADIQGCRTDLEAGDLPDDAFHRGEMLKEKYKGLPYFSIEHKILRAFQSEYKSDEERVLRIAFMAITAAVGSKPYAKMNNERLLALMSGYQKPGPPLHKLVSEYDSTFKMRKLRSLLKQYYKVSFFTKTRGFSVSLTLTDEQLAKMVGKDDRTKEQKPSSPDVEKYLKIISEKDSQIAELQRQVKELTAKLGEQESSNGRKTAFAKETNAAAKKIFIDFYSKNVQGENYYWSAKDGGQMTNILKKLKFARSEKQLDCSEPKLLESLSIFLENITDQWVLSHLSVSVISSKFNELISGARNNYKRTKHANDIEFKGDNSGAFDNEDLTGWG